MQDMKRIIIVGATSGIGLEVARCYLQMGWRIGVAGRKVEALEAIRCSAPQQVCARRIDVTDDDAPDALRLLIEEMGGMDIFLLCSGIGSQNPDLLPETELLTAATNVSGFMRMVCAAYHYFARQGKGHIAVISSIAGTRGLGAAPAYSATKRFQNTYIDALEQLAYINKVNIVFTDIRPGFVDTPLLKSGSYPMLMQASRVAEEIVKAIGRRKRIIVIDWRYRLLVCLWRLIPRWLWAHLPIQNKKKKCLNYQ